jgi:beta-catenin-like protein 1
MPGPRETLLTLCAPLDEIYKSAKLSSNGATRHGHVEDDDDAEAGPAPPPADGDDQDFGPEMPPDDGDDDEGRFFGGGISKQESEILDFVEGADAGAAQEKVDVAWLRKTALNFEKRITKNTELRAKFESEPQKFIGSEADLDSDIKALSVLSEHPELYEEFVRLGCVESLVGLLAHDNTDIAIDAIEIIGELTDEDVDAEDAQWNVLVDALIDADLLGLLVSNFSRFDESDVSERNGVYYALGVAENLCSRSSVATRIGQTPDLLRWLLKRVQRSEPLVSQNRQYAAEILAILAQASSEARRSVIELESIDSMLQLVAPYRRRDPDEGGEEEEYMQNLFEALTCLVDEPEGKAKFIEAEGVELCLLMLKEGKMSKPPALRLLDHAAAGRTAGEVCQKIVEAGGLKATFTLFAKTQDHRLSTHLIAIFASMLRLLPADSAERIRTLAKFVEKDYDKVAKLMKLRHDYDVRVKRAEQENEAGRRAAPQEEAEEWEVQLLSRRLDAGLFTLQTIDVILAWLIAEDGGARRRIRQLFAERDETFAVIKATLSEQIEGLDTETEEGRDTKDILGTLVEFLR